MMPLVTIVFGGALIALGLVTFVLTGMTAKTSLIPAGVGLLFEALGIIALLKPAALKHVMHAAAGLSLLFAGAGLGMGLPKVIRMLNGETVERASAAIAQSIMGGLSLAFLVACVLSFIAARKARQAAASAEAQG